MHYLYRANVHRLLSMHVTYTLTNFCSLLSDNGQPHRSITTSISVISAPCKYSKKSIRLEMLLSWDTKFVTIPNSFCYKAVFLKLLWTQKRAWWKATPVNSASFHFLLIASSFGGLKVLFGIFIMNLLIISKEFSLPTGKFNWVLDYNLLVFWCRCIAGPSLILIL